MLALLILSGCGDDAAAPASEPTVVPGETPGSTASSTPVSSSAAPGTTSTSTAATTATTTRPATSPPTSAPGLVAAEPEDATLLITGLLGTPPPAAIDPADLAELVADALASGGDPTGVDQVSSGDPASAVITVAIRGDDAIGGVRYTLTMETDGSGSWAVSSAASENLCRRGIDGPLCV